MFAQNCVAVVFLVAVVANLVLPKDMELRVAAPSREVPGAVAVIKPRADEPAKQDALADADEASAPPSTK